MTQLTAQEKQRLATIRQAKLEILFTSKDNNGNFLVYNMGQLYLRIMGSNQNRKIGSIYYVNDKILYSKWETHKDIFKKMDAWSVPLLIAKNVDVIWFRTPERDYWIAHSRISALVKTKQAAILKFEGMEKKVYIPRIYWSGEPIIKEESHQMTMLAHDPVPVKRENLSKYAARVGEAWADKLYDYFETPYMTSVGKKIAEARERGVIIYPPPSGVFRAFRETPYDKVKVVILGQDPYHDGNATGLAFECKNNVTPSMTQIVGGFSAQFPHNFSTDIMEGKLNRWAEQGVFLLNTALTVRKGKPTSHLSQWSPFTQEVILKLNGRTDHGMKPVVYLLWGKMAQQYRTLLVDECPVLEAEHPVAGVYSGGRKWIHNNCFLQANRELEKLGVTPIDWT